MQKLVNQFDALELPKPLADGLNAAMGGMAVMGHRLGFSPTDEQVLTSLILDFVKEVRDSHKLGA